MPHLVQCPDCSEDVPAIRERAHVDPDIDRVLADCPTCGRTWVETL